MKTDEQLAAEYQKNGNIASLNELRRNCQQMIQSQVIRYLTGPGHISRSALEAKADELFVDAVKSYKKTGGASFKTHLFNYLRRLDRFTKANANIVYMPEAKANLITTFTTQMKILEDQKRRPPTDAELADHLSWPINSVKSMRKNVRREIPWTQVGGVQEHSQQAAVIEQLIDDIHYELTPDERIVFEHIIGKGRKKIDKGQDLAKATGFSQAKVSSLRTSIANKIRPHLPAGQRMIDL